VYVISLVYVESLIIVVWAIVDIVRQPRYLMTRDRKLGWAWPPALADSFLALSAQSLPTSTFLS
jgi:hypothetical protein